MSWKTAYAYQPLDRYNMHCEPPKNSGEHLLLSCFFFQLRELLTKYGWETLSHPPYSPDKRPPDSDPFLKLRQSVKRRPLKKPGLDVNGCEQSSDSSTMIEPYIASKIPLKVTGSLAREETTLNGNKVPFIQYLLITLKTDSLQDFSKDLRTMEVH